MSTNAVADRSQSVKHLASERLDPVSSDALMAENDELRMQLLTAYGEIQTLAEVRAAPAGPRDGLLEALKAANTLIDNLRQAMGDARHAAMGVCNGRNVTPDTCRFQAANIIDAELARIDATQDALRARLATLTEEQK